MWGFTVPADRVAIEGEVATYRASSFAERAWCPACGTHLWFRSDRSNEYEFMPGLFDGATDMPLARENYADRALAAVRLAGDHERVTAAAREAAHRHV